jgi:AcrR family transcriptional regulator
MLDAAAAVVLKQGVTKLTLDAVAKEAGASKGGVMYNFPSKNALLTALIERLIEGNAQGAVAAAAKMRATPTRQLKAYVKNSVDDPQGDDRISGVLLATVANNPALVERMRTFIAQRFVDTSAGLDFERAAIVHLATEGLWFMELLQISPFTPRQRARLARRLLQMADESAAE